MVSKYLLNSSWLDALSNHIVVRTNHIFLTASEPVFNVVQFVLSFAMFLSFRKTRARHATSICLICLVSTKQEMNNLTDFIERHRQHFLLLFKVNLFCFSNQLGTTDLTHWTEYLKKITFTFLPKNVVIRLFFIFGTQIFHPLKVIIWIETFNLIHDTGVLNRNVWNYQRGFKWK